MITDQEARGSNPLRRTLTLFSLPDWMFTRSDDVDVSKIYGKIKYVDTFADYKVKVVDNFADLHVKEVKNSPNSPGKWKIVDNFAGYKIKTVDNFADFKIKYAD